MSFFQIRICIVIFFLFLKDYLSPKGMDIFLTYEAERSESGELPPETTRYVILKVLENKSCLQPIQVLSSLSCDMIFPFFVYFLQFLEYTLSSPQMYPYDCRAHRRDSLIIIHNSLVNQYPIYLRPCYY